MELRTTADRLAAMAALGDPSRRAVYGLVSRAQAPVSRDEVAGALELARGTAAFHLDRLVRAGLLAVTYRRLTGRSGPGSGRPSKLYAPVQEEISVSLPPRSYDLAGELLAAAVEDSSRSGDPVHVSLRRVAHAAGREIGAAAPSFGEALEECGYQPCREADGSTVLQNCPFHKLALSHTTVVCGLNLELLTAVAAGAAEEDLTPVLDPDPRRCCVRILPGPPAAAD